MADDVAVCDDLLPQRRKHREWANDPRLLSSVAYMGSPMSASVTQTHTWTRRLRQTPSSPTPFRFLPIIFLFYRESGVTGHGFKATL